MKKNNWKIISDARGKSVSDIVKKIWTGRGITNPSVFCNPVGFIHPATAFKNIQAAALTFTKHIKNSSQFLIYADVDADGCSSAAILYHYLSNFGIESKLFINNKKDHGIQEYFFEREIFDEDIVIVVDSINDTTEMYDRILALGKDLIILDHHIPKQEILDRQVDFNLVSSANDYPNPHLSGSGVTWKFVNYIDFLMNTKYSETLYDLASVGIIADVCSIGPEAMENREICHRGFSYLYNVGLRAAVGNTEMTADTVGFSIGPLINAANRMNENELALSLFTTTIESEAKQIVKQLTKIKDKQKTIVGKLFEDIESKVEEQSTEPCYIFYVDDSYGTLGGLIATKAADKWKRPCIVLHESENVFAGSMRSVGVDNFRQLLNDSGCADCQGHEASAGVIIPKADIIHLKEYLREHLTALDLEPETTVDIQLERMQLSPLLLEKLKEINRISGAGFPAVTVLIENVQDYAVKKMSQGKHLCIEVPDMKFLYWNFNDWHTIVENASMSAIGVVDESFFAGKRSTQMLLTDYTFETVPQRNTLW